jgi:hypothetical protein
MLAYGYDYGSYWDNTICKFLLVFVISQLASYFAVFICKHTV